MNWLDEIEARANAATPRPWIAYDWPEFPRRDEYKSCIRIENETTITAFCFDGKPNHDALFIAHSRTDVEKLVKALRVAIDELKKCKTDYYSSERANHTNILQEIERIGNATN